MKKLLIFFLVSAGICAAQTAKDSASVPAADTLTAQDSIKASANNYAVLDTAKNLTDRDYYAAVDSLKRNGTCDFLKLRFAFTKTPAYNPVDMDPGDLFREAYTYLNQSDFNGSAKMLDSILSVNYAHIKAHKLMGYVSAQLGNPQKSKYHYDIYKGLVNSIFNTGDGRSPQKAFIIIDEREETDVYDALNLFLESHNYGEVDGHKFHLSKGFDELKDNAYSFFFNIDIPRNFKK